MSSPEQRAEQLRRAIRDHAYRYYVENDPRIADAEVDLLL
jgi:NAD-dependent DNA ligase